MDDESLCNEDAAIKQIYDNLLHVNTIGYRLPRSQSFLAALVGVKRLCMYAYRPSFSRRF